MWLPREHGTVYRPTSRRRRHVNVQTSAPDSSVRRSKLLSKLRLRVTILFRCDSRLFRLFVRCPCSFLTSRHHNQFVYDVDDM